MRKLFFLLVLASGMLVAQTPNATNTQTIGKFLKLSKVPSGLETDNVLVRGTDGIVKFVPRSEFAGGSQVNADWNAISGPSEILNKPIIPTVVPQVNADWNATSGAAMILNKPTIPDVSGSPNKITKLNATGNGLVDTSITDSGTVVTIANPTEVNSNVSFTSGLKFTNLKKNVSSSAILGTAGTTPFSVVLDNLGNVYVLNAGSNNVTKITPAGVSSVFGTTGTSPESITIDKLNNLYIANTGSASVTKITPAGVSSVFGTTGNSPRSIVIDEFGNVYTANAGANNVTKITAGGVSSILGTTGSSPNGITIDKAGNVYTANAGSNNVTKITPAGVSTTVATTGSSPRNITIDNFGNLYTANVTSSNVSKITPLGISTIIGTVGTSPRGIIADSFGNIYVVNNGSNNVTKITPDGVSTTLGITGSSPFGIAIDKEGSIYTANASSANVSKITQPTIQLLTLDINGNVIKAQANYLTDLDIKTFNNQSILGVGNVNPAGTIVPSSATDIGTAGEIRVSSTFIYTCVATNTWVRAALTTW